MFLDSAHAAARSALSATPLTIDPVHRPCPSTLSIDLANGFDEWPDVSSIPDDTAFHSSKLPWSLGSSLECSASGQSLTSTFFRLFPIGRSASKYMVYSFTRVFLMS